MKPVGNEGSIRRKFQTQFLNELRTLTEHDTTATVDKMVQSIKSSEDIGMLGNTVVMIAKRENDLPKFLYVSKNVEKIFGYTNSDVLGRDLSALVEVIDLEQVNFAMLLLEWVLDFEELKVKENIKNHQNQNFYCGINMKLKASAETKICSVRHTVFLDPDHPFYHVSVFFINDISHLYKADFIWGNFTSLDENDNINITSFYTSAEDYKRVKSKSVLSNRELEVLKLIAHGLDTKEIGKTLFISPGTVEQHRKKMIAKTGVRDTIALIEIARQSKLLEA